MFEPLSQLVHPTTIIKSIPATRASIEDHSTRILRLVLYFDVFRHPLTTAEIVRFVGPEDQVLRACAELESAGRLGARGRYRFRPGREGLVGRREEKARHAERLWPLAQRAARLLAGFPFVQGAFVTGGMSKGCAEPGGDVDFMLLVEPGRVWTLKTLLQGFRRSMPGGIRRLFCTNYLLATDRLLLDDRNAFTAIELATAVPMAGPEACTALIDANSWARTWIPGLDWCHARAASAPVLPPVPAIPWPASGERAAMAAWSWYWDRKYRWLPDEVRSQRFKRREEISTNHLHDFMDWVLRELDQRLVAEGVPAP